MRRTLENSRPSSTSFPETKSSRRTVSLPKSLSTSRSSRTGRGRCSRRRTSTPLRISESLRTERSSLLESRYFVRSCFLRRRFSFSPRPLVCFHFLLHASALHLLHLRRIYLYLERPSYTPCLLSLMIFTALTFATRKNEKERAKETSIASCQVVPNQPKYCSR